MNPSALASDGAPVPPGSTAAAGISAATHRRLLLAASIGAAIEHFDFFCYAFIAPIVFGEAFFPRMDALAGTLAVYTTFAVGFAARPLGGMVFGHYGDRIGRRKVLLVTLLTMGVASFLIGCLPTYATLGLWAPLMLVVLRFVQGFAFGGEYMNAVTLSLEGAPTGRRGFFASFINASGPLGIIAASGTIAALTGVFGTPAFAAWAWRLPFLFSIVLVAIGTSMRLRIDESALFQAARARTRSAELPISQVFKRWKLPVVRGLLINMVHSSFQYLCSVFVLGYAVKRLGMSASGITTGTTLANVLELLMVPLLAWASDRWGRKPLLLTGIAAAALWFPWVIHSLADRNMGLLILGLVGGIGVVHAMMFAPEAAFSAEQFPTEVRVSGGSLGKQLGIVLGGGCSPLIATALMGSGADLSPVVLYFEAIAALAFFGLLMSPESARQDL